MVQKFSSVHNDQFENTKWFNGGLINVSHNCIDRHLDKHSEKTALIWEGDDPQDNKMISIKTLRTSLSICKYFKKIKRQKRYSSLYLYADDTRGSFAMLACTRIGAIHSVVLEDFLLNPLKIEFLILIVVL